MIIDLVFLVAVEENSMKCSLVVIFIFLFFFQLLNMMSNIQTFDVVVSPTFLKHSKGLLMILFTTFTSFGLLSYCITI